MQQTETSIHMIKMINEFKLTVVHFARPNPPALCPDLWMREDLPLDKKTVENQDWAAGPSAGRGPLSRGPAFSKTQSSSRLEDRGLFRSANILEIANVVLLVVFLLFCYVRRRQFAVKRVSMFS